MSVQDLDALAIATAMVDRRYRASLVALFALDARLGQTLASTREVIVGQMRLAWWREALGRLDSAAAPAEPVLRDLADRVIGHGITGAALAAIPGGWEAILIADPIDDMALAAHAQERGARLFAAAATLLGGTSTETVIAAAGRGWALADLAHGSSDPAVVDRARAAARIALHDAFAGRWPRAVRPLGVLALLARFDLADRPSRIRDLSRLVCFRMTGR